MCSVSHYSFEIAASGQLDCWVPESEPGSFAFGQADSEILGYPGFEAYCWAEPASGSVETVALVAESFQVESHVSDLGALGLVQRVSSASGLEAGPAQLVVGPDLEPRKALHHFEQFVVQML